MPMRKVLTQGDDYSGHSTPTGGTGQVPETSSGQVMSAEIENIII